MTTPSDGKIRAALERLEKRRAYFHGGSPGLFDGQTNIDLLRDDADLISAHIAALEALSSPPEPIGGEALRAMALAIHAARFDSPNGWREVPEPDASDMEYATRLARAALAVFSPPSTPDGEAVRAAISALEPFAELVSNKNTDAFHIWPDDSGNWLARDHAWGGRITVDHMRAARAALTALRRSGEGV